MSASARAPLNFLWVIDFEYAPRLHHGAYLRYFNFAPNLLAQGHTVTFAVNFLDSDRRPGIEYLKLLKAQRVFTDFVEVNFEVPVWRLRIAARVIHPVLANLVLRPAQRRFASRIDEVAEDRGANVILISTNRLLFLPQESRSGCGFIYDLSDCDTLYARRQIRFLVQRGDFGCLPSAFKFALFSYLRERYYGQKPVMKVMVSPVDKKSIDEITGKPQMSAVVLNGVKGDARRGRYAKVPGRIIFTGNMDFPPNYEAALWFVDHVLPLVLKHRPDACFVIAGANPIPVIRSRASTNVIVTGYVDDLDREIACSEMFVAPLVSGSGFKNKLLEAIVNGTSVVATSIAVEFLDESIRDLMVIADSPAEMAEAIVTIWRDPKAAQTRAEKLHGLITAQFNWTSQTAKIIELAKKAVV